MVGLHIASWGAYKDAPYEGFRLISYLRSVLLAAVLAIVITVLAPGLAPSIVVLVGAVYAVERLATEGWKSILREQDQTLYTIPMRLGFRDNLSTTLGSATPPGRYSGSVPSPRLLN